MPGFDGTGPRGLGPMTGRGKGYCAIALPPPGTGRAPYGYAGLAGRPVQMSPTGLCPQTVYPYRMPRADVRSLAPFFGTRLGRRLGRRWGWGRGRWR